MVVLRNVVCILNKVDIVSVLAKENTVPVWAKRERVLAQEDEVAIRAQP